ncbi:MAG TPA: hypothetical protein VMN60_05035 [Longimicrobiales bacterium]|nr:hypothetical protein [Longimicrobiales bacterium]
MEADPQRTALALTSQSAVTVPAEVTVAAGQTSATFTATAAALGTANITAQRASGVKSVTMVVAAVEVMGIQLPATMPENGSATGTILLRGPATSPLQVTLTSSGDAVRVPPEVTISAGATSAEFPVLTAGPGSATIKAKRLGGTIERQIAVNVITDNEVIALSFKSPGVLEGNQVAGTVTLTKAAGAGGVTVALSGGSAFVTIPATVTIPAGEMAGTFTATATAPGNAVISARRGNGTARQAPLVVRGVAVQSVAFMAREIQVGGAGAIGTVTLDAPAPPGGLAVLLTSSVGSLTLPARLTIPAGSISATFTVTASGTATPGSASIEAARMSGVTGVPMGTKAATTLTIIQ